MSADLTEAERGDAFRCFVEAGRRVAGKPIDAAPTLGPLRHEDVIPDPDGRIVDALQTELRLEYVPKAERSPRHLGGPYRPGFCRLCEGPILVPHGHTKVAALRNWKRAPALRCFGMNAWDPIRSERADFFVYKRATWHDWCWRYANLVRSADPGAIASRRGERLYSCAACAFPIELAQGAGRRWSSVGCVPWVSRAALVAGLSPLDLEKMKGGGEVDHIIPLWAGGIAHLSNLQVLCVPCHRAKTATEAWQRSRARKRWHHANLGFGVTHT